MAAAFANHLGKLCLRIAKFVNKPLICFAFFHRIEISALHIFDNAYLQRLAVGQLLHHGRHGVKLGDLRGAPAAFAGNDFKTIGRAFERAHNQRLQNARPSKRLGQRLQLIRIKILSRLKRPRLQLVGAQHPQSVTRCGN